MGYFANGTEGEYYREKYCERCVNWHDKASTPETPGCPIMDLHFLYNYDDCDKPESYLHSLIPLKDGHNEECSMFLERTDGGYKYNERVVYTEDLERWKAGVAGWKR